MATRLTEGMVWQALKDNPYGMGIVAEGDYVEITDARDAVCYKLNAGGAMVGMAYAFPLDPTGLFRFVGTKFGGKTLTPNQHPIFGF